MRSHRRVSFPSSSPSAALSIVVGLTLVACRDMPSLSAGACGNGVLEVERGEQCDLSEDTALGEGLRCGDPSDALRACRYVCSRTDVSGPGCPSGWSCSEEGVCRSAASEFEEFEDSPIELGRFQTLDLADVDGDGRSDLVTTGGQGLSVFFGRPSSPFETTYGLDIRPSIYAPALGDVEAKSTNGRTDVVFSTEAGLMLLLGQRDDTFTPVLASQLPLERALVSQIRALRAGEVTLARECGPRDEVLRYTVVMRNDGAASLQAIGRSDLPISLGTGSALPEQIFSGNLGDPRAETVVVALPGSTRVTLLKPRCTGVRPSLFEDPIILETTYPIAQVLRGTRPRVAPTVMALDIDDDSYVDLIFPVIYDGRTAVAAAHGTPSGEFAPPKLEPLFDAIPADTLGGDILLPDRSDADRAWPVAVGFLDADDAPEVVSVRGVFTVKAGLQPFNLTIPRIEQAVFAQVLSDLDVSGDDPLELIIRPIGEPRLEVYSASGRRATVDTNGAPSLLRVANFDGLPGDEVAFVELGAVAGASISVLYRDGAGFVVVPMGEPSGEVESLFAVRPRLGEDDQPTGPADLLVVAAPPADESWAVSVLSGTSGRALIARLGGIRSGRPILGKFRDRRSAQPDLFVATSTDLQFAPGQASGRFGEGEAFTQAPYAGALADKSLVYPCTPIIVGPFDVDLGRDWVLALRQDGCLGTTPSVPTDDPTANEQLLALSPSPGGPTVFVRGLDLPAKLSAMRSADLDRNGRPDLMFYEDVTAGETAASTPGQSSILTIAWNPTVRGASIVLDPPELKRVDLGARLIMSVTTGNFDADIEPELLVLTTSPSGPPTIDVFVVQPDPGGDGLVTPNFSLAVSALSRPEVLALDVDGDRLDDVVVGDGRQVHLFRSKASDEVGR